MKRMIAGFLLLAMLCAWTAAAGAEGACIPDPRVYFGVEPRESGVSDDQKSQWMSFKFETGEECDRAFEEYARLLQDERFELKMILDDDWKMLFDYRGSADIEKVKDLSNDASYTVKLVNFQEYGALIEITVSMDVELKGTGDAPGTPYRTIGPEKSTGAGTGSSGKDDCMFCQGSGRCSECGGSGRVRNWVPGTREYLEQNCRSCSGTGRCFWCGGSGED